MTHVRALALGASLLAISAVPAAAHTTVSASKPAANATVAVLPASISVTFDARLLRVERVILTPPSGKNAVRSFAINAKNKQQLVIKTKRAGSGQYNLYWKVTGADGHTITGRLRFKTTRAS